MDATFSIDKAIREGDYQTVKGFIRKGGSKADVILQESSHLSALTLATVCGQTKIVKYLIRHRAFLDVKDNQGMTAAMYSCSYNYHEILSLLINANADVSDVDNNGKTALHHAAMEGSLDCLQILLDLDCMDIDKVDMENESPVMCASYGQNGYGNYLECLTTLINKNCDLNKKNQQGNSPLITAIRQRKLDRAVLLINKGADVNLINKNRKTALTTAFEQSINQAMIPLIDRLLTTGAKPSITSSDEIFIHEMIARGQNLIVQKMLINGCTPWLRFCKENIFDFHIPERISPLAVALLCNNLGMAKYLICNSFFTTFDLCDLPKNEHILSCLESRRYIHCLSLLRNLFSNPLPLLTLCRVKAAQMYQTLSHKDYKYKEYILSQLSQDEQKAILFQSGNTKICREEWDIIPLIFNNEKKFCDGPLADNWPIGYHLELCKFDCCNGKGFRIVNTDRHAAGESTSDDSD